ncbi:Probable glutamate receptor [Eumeta japonica]|uniref:Probable glutamate receptor n=1 Tax=Eumeta variegata TaxID=151549 RepID=A0A4C1V5H2_EUMVA|nr:Probable glutamate receptor [Eumeta japonica]
MWVLRCSAPRGPPVISFHSRDQLQNCTNNSWRARSGRIVPRSDRSRSCLRPGRQFITDVIIEGQTSMRATRVWVVTAALVHPRLRRKHQCVADLLDSKYELVNSSKTFNAHELMFGSMAPDAEMVTTPKPEQHIVFVTDFSCVNNSMFVRMNNRLFRAPYRWIIIDSSSISNRESLLNSMENVIILSDSEVIISQKDDKGSYNLDYVYKIESRRTWLKHQFGCWNPKEKLKTAVDNRVIALRRRNLKGLEISACYVVTDNDTLKHLTDGLNAHIDPVTKVSFPTINHLFDFINANRKFVYTNSWGYLINGSWSGMTGYLVEGRVEIGGSPMFLTAERLPYVEFVTSPIPTKSKFVFRQPKLSYEYNLFVLPFKNNVWYCCIATFFVLCFAVFVVTAWEWKKFNSDKERYTDAGILRNKITDILLIVFGAACQQGSSTALKGSLGRIVMFILFLAFLFLYTSYSANIVALLQSSSPRIRSLEDLLHSRLKFGVQDTVYNRYYFRMATEPIRKTIYETKVAPSGTNPKFMSLEEGVKKMQKGLFAFHMDTGVGYKFVGKYFNEQEKCNLKEIQYLQVQYPWIAIRKHTPHREILKIGLRRIQEHGLQSRENVFFYLKKPKCSGHVTSFVSVSIVDCYPAILVLLYGYSVAFALLLMEILLHWRRQRRQFYHF